MCFRRRRIGERTRRRDGRRAVRRHHQHGHRGVLRGTVVPVRGRRPVAAAAAVPQHRVPAVGRGQPEDGGGRRVHVGGAATVPSVRRGRRRAAGEPDVRHGGRDTGALAERDHREPEPAVGHRQGVRAQAQLVRPGRRRRRPPAQGAGRGGRRRGQQQPGGGRRGRLRPVREPQEGPRRVRGQPQDHVHAVPAGRPPVLREVRPRRDVHRGHDQARAEGERHLQKHR